MIVFVTYNIYCSMITWSLMTMIVNTVDHNKTTYSDNDKWLLINH